MIATARAASWANLEYMPTEHVPVLATELVELLAPRPGQTAVDCTFGGGGHAALIAHRIGPKGTLVCIDRDPAAEVRFREMAADFPCKSRFVRAEFSEGLRALGAEGLQAVAPNARERQAPPQGLVP